jgi:hypothetical protein
VSVCVSCTVCHTQMYQTTQNNTKTAKGPRPPRPPRPFPSDTRTRRKLGHRRPARRQGAVALEETQRPVVPPGGGQLRQVFAERGEVGLGRLDGQDKRGDEREDADVGAGELAEALVGAHADDGHGPEQDPQDRLPLLLHPVCASMCVVVMGVCRCWVDELNGGGLWARAVKCIDK